MDLKRLPSNNISQPNVDPVTEGRVSRKKQKPTVNLANDIIDVTTTLYDDVVVPAIKSALSDFISNGIEMVLWGAGDRRRGSRNYNHVSTRRPARNYSNVSRNDRGRTAKVNRGVSVDDIFFVSRKDAELVLGRMYELIADYGWCSVGDLYSLAGISSDPTHERYGWYNIDGSRIRQSSDGYYINLPKPSYDE